MRIDSVFLFPFLLTFTTAFAEEPARNISGVYPHLRMWNDENECGTGAVVVWQGDLWAITYAPHAPGGSSDKLYRITPDLERSSKMACWAGHLSTHSSSSIEPWCSRCSS